MTTFVLAALAVLLCGPDALHYAKGAPHRWRALLRQEQPQVRKFSPASVPSASVEDVQLGTYADLQARHDSLLVAEADTLHPRLISGRCPFCVKLGLRSEVSRIYTSGMLIDRREYWDKQGRHVYEDQHPSYCSYQCSRWHRWNGECQ